MQKTLSRKVYKSYSEYYLCRSADDTRTFSEETEIRDPCFWHSISSTVIEIDAIFFMMTLDLIKCKVGLFV
jgi:hypothetical protein